MATKAELCEYFEKRPDQHSNTDRRSYWQEEAPKSKKVECPVCGRRMMGWMFLQAEGEIVKYAIPIHKKKHWWKKPKKKVEKNMAPRGK